MRFRQVASRTREPSPGEYDLKSDFEKEKPGTARYSFGLGR